MALKLKVSKCNAMMLALVLPPHKDFFYIRPCTKVKLSHTPTITVHINDSVAIKTSF